MRKLLWPSLALLLSTVTAWSSDPAITYKHAIEECGGESVWRYDDGMTSPDLVAAVILGVCRRQNQPLYAAASAGRTNAWMAGFERAAAEELTGLVLWHRSNRARSGPK